MKNIIDRFKKFKIFIGPEVWKLFVLSIVVGFSMFLVESSFIFVFQGFFCAIGFLNHSQSQLPNWYPTEGFLPILSLLLFGIIRGCIMILRHTIGGQTSLAFMANLRLRLLKLVLYNNGNLNNAEVINLFSERINHSGSVLQGISQIILTSVTALCLLILGMKMAPFEMLISIFLSAVLMLPMRKLNEVIGNLGDESRKSSDQTLSSLYSGLRNNLFLKIHGLIHTFIDTASEHLHDYRKHYEKYYFVGAVRNFSPNIIGIFVLCGLTLVEIYYLKNLNSVQFISFFYLFMRFAQSISDINLNLSEIRLLWGSFKQVYSWVVKIDNVVQDKSLIKNSVQFSLTVPIRINVRDIDFTFDNKNNLFNKLSFEVSSGDFLLIKGKSGSGKSTLIRVLLGLLPSSIGSIKINDLPIDLISDSLRMEVGYVGPEPYIIPGTIRQNLMFGNERLSFTDQEMFNFLHKVGLDKEVISLDTYLSESEGLSTGQKQRLSFARALMRQPKVLVLDEATANLDQVTESVLLDTIKSETKNLLVIAVSHKNSFDEFATLEINLNKKI